MRFKKKLWRKNRREGVKDSRSVLDFISIQNCHQEFMLRTRLQFTKMLQLKRECRQMTEELEALKEACKNKMINKFGMLIDLDELEENLLEKLWFEMKIDDNAIRKSYEKKDSAIKVSFEIFICLKYD